MLAKEVMERRVVLGVLANHLNLILSKDSKSMLTDLISQTFVVCEHARVQLGVP